MKMIVADRILPWRPAAGNRLVSVRRLSCHAKNQGSTLLPEGRTDDCSRRVAGPAPPPVCWQRRQGAASQGVYLIAAGSQEEPRLGLAEPPATGAGQQHPVWAAAGIGQDLQLTGAAAESQRAEHHTDNTTRARCEACRATAGLDKITGGKNALDAQCHATGVAQSYRLAGRCTTKDIVAIADRGNR